MCALNAAGLEGLPTTYILTTYFASCDCVCFCGCLVLHTAAYMYVSYTFSRDLE
jgi:hypothetical protein